jgi:hypothetical protein
MKSCRKMSMMQRRAGWLLAIAAAGLIAAAPALAEHRAVRLGSPSTRFAPPLSSPEQLWTLFTDRSTAADVAAILQQVGWAGKVEDLRRAAAVGAITEVRLPKGTRMPFMASREAGRPVALIDVLWVGEEPIDAYAFEFSSGGRRCRCVTPKVCSNFFLVDLGPERPSLALVMTAAPEANRCDPIPVQVTVQNTSSVLLPRVRVTPTLPAGLRMANGQTALSLDAGDLPPGGSRQFTFNVLAAATGPYTSRAQATSDGGGQAEASATIRVRGPVLAVTCSAAAKVLMGRPVEVCLDVQNLGDAAESKATLTLGVPAGATVSSTTGGGASQDGQVVWEISDLLPGVSRRVCATINPQAMGPLTLASAVRGACAGPAESQCVMQVEGIWAVLFEVVDLEDPIAVGAQTTYDIKVVNQGSAAATRVQVVCTLEETQEFVSGTGPTPVSAQGQTVTMSPVAALDPGAEVSWRVVVKAVKAGDVRFHAALTGDQFAQPIEETEATRQY